MASVGNAISVPEIISCIRKESEQNRGQMAEIAAPVTVEASQPLQFLPAAVDSLSQSRLLAVSCPARFLHQRIP